MAIVMLVSRSHVKCAAIPPIVISNAYMRHAIFAARTPIPSKS